MASRRAKGVEREQAVVEAACELIAERGLAELRMSDVAERAGMSIGHVTYYFATKRELLVRAITYSEQTFQKQVRDELARQDDPWRRLRTLVELAAASGPMDRGWLLWFEVWANAAVDEEVAAAQRQLDGWWRQTLSEVVADGVGRGVFDPPDAARAVWVISGLTDGLSVQLALGALALSRKKLISAVLEVAAAMLRSDPATRGPR